MGEAKDIVGSPKDEYVAPKKGDDVVRVGKKGTVLASLTEVIDDLDRAIQVKQGDLTSEGHSAIPENHYKLGILKGADSLVRRARAMLQDYGSDLDTALHPLQDALAVKGEEVEAHGDMAHFTEAKDEDEDPEIEDEDEDSDIEDDTCDKCGEYLDENGNCPDCHGKSPESKEKV